LFTLKLFIAAIVSAPNLFYRFHYNFKTTQCK